jgi:hypothetical protein
MKQSLSLIIEQIEHGLFTYRELLLILRAMVKYAARQYGEPDSPVRNMVEKLSAFIEEESR